MNWTGGPLSRHSRNTASSLTMKQKQYFAKARSKLLNKPTRRTPVEWPIVSETKTVPDQEKPELSAYNLLTPHVYQPRLQYGGDNGGDHKLARKRRGLDVTFRPATGYAVSQSNRKLGSIHASQSKTTTSMVPDNKFNGLEQTLHTDAKDYQLQFGQTRRGVDSGDEAETLEERKLRILRRDDWVGANIRRPVKLEFFAARNDESERVGKRRRLTANDDNPLGAVKRQRHRSPFESCTPLLFGGSAHRQQKHAPTPYEWSTGPRNNIRISIGGRQVCAGASSSTSYGKVIGVHGTSSQTARSDVMLLDGSEGGTPYCQPSQRPQQFPSDELLPNMRTPTTDITNSAWRNYHTRSKTIHRQPILSSSSGSRGALDRSYNFLSNSLRPKVPQTWVATDISLLSHSLNLGASTNYTHRNPAMATLRSSEAESVDYAMEHHDSDPAQILHEAAGPRTSLPLGACITNVSKQLSHSARKLQSLAQDKSRKLIHSSSQPRLLHPAPQNLKVSQVLQTKTSESADSNAGQLGITSRVRQSEKLDEQVWKSWKLFTNQNDKEDGVSEEKTSDACISRGVSVHARHDTRLKSVQPTDTESLVRMKYLQNIGLTESADDHLQGDVARKSKVGTGDNMKAACQLSQEKSIPLKVTLKPPVTDYRNLFLSRTTKSRHPPKEVQFPPKPTQENRDEAWMKFILSDSDDEDALAVLNRPLHQQSHHQASQNQSRESSMLPQTSSKTRSNVQPDFTTPVRDKFIHTLPSNHMRSNSTVSRNCVQASILTTHRSHLSFDDVSACSMHVQRCSSTPL